MRSLVQGSQKRIISCRWGVGRYSQIPGEISRFWSYWSDSGNSARFQQSDTKILRSTVVELGYQQTTVPSGGEFP